jgi:RNA methyltransferase, TrmH family
METLNLKDLFCSIQKVFMISKNKIKLIKSLALKKQRQKEQLFLVEGDKNVLEVLGSENFRVSEIYGTESFLATNKWLVSAAGHIIRVTPEEIKKASLLKNPQNALALCNIPEQEKEVPRVNDFSIFLDGLQDPGNLGTIIRLCDWFGMDRLFCSSETVDVYNPKVIQASMGSFCRVKLYYTSFDALADMLSGSDIPIFGTFTDGSNIYTGKLPDKALVVFGNEGKGISSETAERIKNRISVPSFGKSADKAESLNVAVAAGIICSEFKRQAYGMYPTQNESRE